MRDAAADPKVRELISTQDFIPYGNMTLIDFNLELNQQVKEFNQLSQKFNITVK